VLGSDGLRERSNPASTKRQKGNFSIVLDGNGNPVLVIETLSVVILPFNEVSEQFAFEEGKGNISLAHRRRL
jgi:uncharacterized protein YhfF